MKNAVILVAFSLASSLASGQKLYRCKDEQGNSSYQQAPCPKAEQEAGELRYQRQPDRPHWSLANHEAEQAREAYERQQAHVLESEIQGQRPHSASSPDRRGRQYLNPASQEAEERRRLEHLAGSREGRAMLRAMSGQPSPAATAPPAPQTKTYFDQHGGTYTQPPGGPILDNKTGRPCRKEGAELVCE